jgi:outer membrane lipoprotein
MKTLLVFCILLLAACSNLPTAIQNAPSPDLSYQQAMQDIASHKNAPVRWGGVIVEVENEQDESLVQVLYYPLGSFGRPLTDQTYTGRFIIKSADFLDPAVYAKNARITVAGTLDGAMERTIGKKTVRLPLVLASDIYQWPYYNPSDYGNFGYRYGGYRPYWDYYPFSWGGGYGVYPNYYWR